MRYRVASRAELPERVGWRVEVAGRELALFRLGDAIHALDGICPHRGAALAFGEVRGDLVHCPLHAWPFHIPTGACVDEPGCAVERFEVQVDGDDVFVEL